MALLSTGVTATETQVLVNETLLDAPTTVTELNLDTSFERGGPKNVLLTPELDLSEPGFGAPGNFSPVYSPGSVSSEDSGILNATDNDYLLSSLFGVDFSQLTPSLPSEAKDILDPPQAQTLVHHPLKVEMATTGTTASKEQIDRNRKNAEAARLNRQKKKRYVEDLEKSCSTLKTENVILKTKCHEFQQRCIRLQSEVQYLKSVLMNESTLSSLIQNIPDIKGIKLSSSFSRKRPLLSENTENPAKRPKPNSHSGGVCLHVAKDAVSLEFCANCSKQAVS